MATLKEKLWNLVVPGYAAIWSKPGYDASSIPDLTGKTALVTGVNVGLGFESALQLAKKGAHVFITARSQEKGDEALGAIKDQSGNEKVELLIVDFASIKQTKAAAEALLASGVKLDILMNNAGVLESDFRLTADGIEYCFGVNHVGPFVWTMTLIPALNPSARIVNVTSYAQSGCMAAPCYDNTINTPDFKPGWPKQQPSWLMRYSESKLANVLFTKKLQQRLGDDYFVNCCHPGTIHTSLNRTIEAQPFVGRIIWLLTSSLAQTVTIGALTQLFLATAPDIENEKVHGEYYVCVAKRAPEKLNKLAFDEELSEKLWKYTEEIIEEKLRTE